VIKAARHAQAGVALFRKGTEPNTEFEEVAFAPAGSMFDQKVAGRVKLDDVTLEKGILQDGSNNTHDPQIPIAGAS